MPNAPAKRKSEIANPIRSGCIRNSIRWKIKIGFPSADRWQSKVHVAVDPVSEVAS
jgi:hypothetical protein